jgi:DNA-binding PadR family transcriptional regulator
VIASCFWGLVGLALLIGAVDACLYAREQERARAALLLALRSGAGYGLELVERVKAQTRGELDLGDRVFGVLHTLEREGLLEAFDGPVAVVGAQPRRYYRLRWRDGRGGGS